MSEAGRRDILKNFLLSVWAMATFVLIFVVGLLIHEMTQAGQDPLASLRVPKDTAPPAPIEPRGETQLGARGISLYFASDDARALVEETRTIEYSSSVATNCKLALKALAEGPRDILTRIMPEATKVRAVYLLDDGELVVDFSRELQSGLGRYKSASAEALFVYGVVNTLTQPALQTERDPKIRSVRFLIEGAPPMDTFPAHLDLSAPIEPDTRWVETAS